MTLFTLRSNGNSKISIAFTILGLGCVSFLSAEAFIRGSVWDKDPLAQAVNLFTMSKNSSYEFIAFGASEVARGFIPDDSGLERNFAVGGEHIALTAEKVKLFFETGSSEYVFLPATGVTIQRSVIEGDYRSSLYAEGLVRPNGFLISVDYFKNNFLKYLMTVVTKGGLFPTVSFGRFGGQFSTKYDELEHLDELSSGDKLALIDKYLSELSYPARPEQELEFEGDFLYRDAVATALGSGAKVCLLQMPYAPELVVGLEKSVWAGDVVKRFWEMWSLKHGVKYLDLMSVVSDTSYYRDPTHLNLNGAKYFSTHLKNACRQAWDI
jgi:hypothetical protein